MGEIVVTPNGRDALEAGTFTDDSGKTFVALTFRQESGDHVIVTFTPDLFRDYVGHLNRVVQTIGD